MRIPAISEFLKNLKRGQTGETLLEILVSVALIGVIGVVFLQAMGTSTDSMAMVEEFNAAESLARTQMEYIKSQDFSDDVWNYTLTVSQREPSQQPSWWDESNSPLLSEEYCNYSVSCSAEDADIDSDGTNDDGARKITVKVFHYANTDPVMTLVGYKVKR
jgi:type II secretory pathway pseudopilin PulG